ncbi:unnamed protein product, partial [Diplocarpon coronariae]
VHFHM